MTVMLNEVKHLYNKDSSLALRMTVGVIIHVITIKYTDNEKNVIISSCCTLPVCLMRRGSDRNHRELSEIQG